MIPIQQNQDLRPTHEVFSQQECEAEEDPAPTPATRFSPAGGITAADEEKLGALFLQLDESFRDKRRAFIHEKTTELEAEFQAKLEAAVEARLQQLQQQAAHQPELQLAAA